MLLQLPVLQTGKIFFLLTKTCIHPSEVLNSAPKCERFSHNNPSHLRELLSYEEKNDAKIFVLEGVYSMEGHIAKLPDFVQLAKEHRAFVVVDDAWIWSTGVGGSRGM